MRQFALADLEKTAEDIERLKEIYFAAGGEQAARTTAEAAVAAAMRWIEIALSAYEATGPEDG